MMVKYEIIVKVISFIYVFAKYYTKSKILHSRALSLGIKIPHTVSDTAPQIQNCSVSQYYHPQ